MRSRSLLPILTTVALALAGCGSSPAASTTPTASPLALNHVHSIVVLPTNPRVLYMGTHYHLYTSTDGGKTWHPLSSMMMLSMTMDPAHPCTLYAVSNKRGLLKTTDGGKHWLPPASHLPKGQITGVVFDAPYRAVLAYGVGVYRSVDGGEHWSNALKGQSITSVAVSGDGTAYAASDTGIAVSHDGGVHWVAVKSAVSQPVIQVVAAQHVAYAAGAVTVLKSSDDGRTWKVLSSAPVGTEFLGLSPTRPNEVFGEVGGRGFFASYDGGQTWHPASQGIHDRNFNASVVKVASSAPNVVYTGSWGLHFYASHDAGRHWTRVATLIR